MQGVWKQFVQREASPLVQFIKYAICGVAAVIVHVSLFYTLSWLLIPALNEGDAFVRLLHLSVPPLSDAVRARNAMINNALAFVLSNLSAYLTNIFWVFESGREYPPVDFVLAKMGLSSRLKLRSFIHRAVEIILFYVIAGIAVAIGTIIMGLQINKFQVTTTVAFITQSVVTVIINFALRKFLIFKR